MVHCSSPSLLCSECQFSSSFSSLCLVQFADFVSYIGVCPPSFHIYQEPNGTAAEKRYGVDRATVVCATLSMSSRQSQNNAKQKNWLSKLLWHIAGTIRPPALNPRTSCLHTNNLPNPPQLLVPSRLRHRRCRRCSSTKVPDRLSSINPQRLG